MWTRYELKINAKKCLRKYYWHALVVVLIAGFLTGGGSTGINRINAVWTALKEEMHSFSPQMLLAVIGSIAMIVVVSLVLSLAMTIFLGNPLRVGACRFFMESRGMGRSAGITKVFWAFQCGQFGNIVKTMFLRDLYIILWSLVLVIPGIIKAYEYHMVPYILSENPDMDSREVFQLSKKMMTGQKFAAFVLELSFIGWNLLGALLCVLGMWFVVPYVDATKAELYGILRKEYVPFGLKGYGEMYEQEGESIWQ